MLVRDFLLIELRRDFLRRLQRFLHLLGKFIGSHTSISLPKGRQDCNSGRRLVNASKNFSSMSGNVRSMVLGPSVLYGVAVIALVLTLSRHSRLLSGAVHLALCWSCWRNVAFAALEVNRHEYPLKRETEISRKDAKPLSFGRSNPVFAPSRLCVTTLAQPGRIGTRQAVPLPYNRDNEGTAGLACDSLRWASETKYEHGP